MNPVPEFWEISMHGYAHPAKVSRLKDRLIDLGFRMMHTGNAVKWRVAHTKPSAMVLWLMSESESLAELDVKVQTYYYNTRSN